MSEPHCSEKSLSGPEIIFPTVLLQVMKQNKLGTFDLTQIAGGPLGSFAQQAAACGRVRMGSRGAALRCGFLQSKQVN